MSLFLLILGAVTAAAGLGLVASGVSIQEHVFDPAALAPGVVALVGGFVLVGLGLAVRVLQQIEMALAARPKLREPRSVETAQGELSREPASALSQSATEPEVATPSEAAAAEDAGSTRLREKFPALVRINNASIVEETDVSLLPAASARAEQEGGLEIGNIRRVAVGAPQRRGNGVAQAPAARRLESAPAGSQHERVKISMFDSLWPKGPPGGRAERAAPAATPAAEPEPSVEPADAGRATAVEPPARPGPAVLKSGVVDGMAYTLYTDGSIEAQLPQGLVRFGSITELRNHIEQSS